MEVSGHHVSQSTGGDQGPVNRKLSTGEERVFKNLAPFHSNVKSIEEEKIRVINEFSVYRE